MSGVRIATSALLLLYVGASVSGQQPVRQPVHRPMVFAPDDQNRGFEHAVPPSDLVLDALLDTEEARLDSETREEIAKLDRESKRKIFQVVRLDIGRVNEEDYIALGSGPMTGADNSWFWIVTVRQGKARVLLFTNGLTVEILRRKTNGYYDIKESWGSDAGWGIRLYHYAGSGYKLVQERWHNAKP